MEIGEAFGLLGVSLGLGLLVGLQREKVASRVAGIRTFALVSVLGTLTAMLSEDLGQWTVGAGLLAVVALLVMANLVRARMNDPSPGQTTEIAVLVVYCIGAYVVVGHMGVAVAAGAGTAILLHLKPALHGFVEKLGERDLRAMMQFALISLVVLPVLPDRAYGPYAVLNPHHIWLMVVLVSALGLVGYIAFKLLGSGRGMLATGLIGGAISSTATTVSHARQTRGKGEGARAAVIIIVLAEAVSFIRVFIEIGAIAGSHITALAGPIGVLFGASVAAGLIVWLTGRNADDSVSPPENPAQLRIAIVFGLVYGAVLLAVAAARDLLGEGGMYAAAALSGVADMDAITLSSARMLADGRITAEVAWRAIVIALMSNLVAKVVIVGFVGSRQLFWRVAIVFGALIAVGGGILLLWPEGEGAAPRRDAPSAQSGTAEPEGPARGVGEDESAAENGAAEGRDAQPPTPNGAGMMDGSDTVPSMR